MPRKMLASLSLPVFLASATLAANATTPFIPQSYFFDWNDPAQGPVPIPVTHQCDTIHIKWARSAALGPNPSPPYFLQIYTSTSIEPFIVHAGVGLEYDFVVPFPVDTQYQICMFDKNGYTGGCQGIYTVVEPLANGTSSCEPIPSMGTLAVEGTVDNGPISRFGWIDSCTDISVLPRNGTPPFTYTIAPSLHPPYNITSDYATPMNWTVVLSWASPFFISVVDSAGNGWSQGPLHSGGNGKTWCLDTDKASLTGSSNDTNTADMVAKSTVIAAGAGAGVGGLVLGVLVGGLIAFCVFKKKRAPSEEMRPHIEQFASYHKGNRDSDRPTEATSPLNSPMGYQQTLPGLTQNQMNGHPGLSPQHSDFTYNRDSYMTNGVPSATFPNQATAGPYRDMIHAVPRHGGSSIHGAHLHDPAARSDVESIAGPSSSQNDRPQSERVYIVHNDSGRPPVQVYTGDATDVVELPPRYDNGSAPAGAGSITKQRQAFHDYAQHPSQSGVSIEGPISPPRGPRTPLPPVPQQPSRY